MPVDAVAVAANIVERFVAAWAAHDATQFASLFHEDADFTNIFGAHAKGRAAIAAMHAPVFAGVFRNSILETASPSCRAVRHDVIAVDLPWTLRGLSGPEGQPLPDRRGNLSFVLTHEPDWAILIAHNTDLTESPDARSFKSAGSAAEKDAYAQCREARPPLT